MTKVIDAVYENGVFKPLEDVEIREHEKVAIRIVHIDEWQASFSRIIDKIHERTSRFSPEEIDAEIDAAVKEVREARRVRSGSN